MKKYVTLKLILVLLLFLPKTTYAQGPVLTATGNQTYCDAPLNIAQTVSITDPSATTTDASVYIQIPTGYVFGEDLLTLTGTHPNISSTWSETEGKLTLSPIPLGGTVSYTELEAAILDVEYNSSSMTPVAGEKTFSILLGVGNRELSYLPRNGHYYEYVPLLGVTWTTARFLAETYVYHGLQGYLVTLTAADEQQIAGIQAPGAGWIGATDEAVEGDWRWVTGPEGLANGGTGTPFWNGLGCLGCGGFNVPTPDGEFSFWNTNYSEPNSANPGEDYAHIVDPDLPGSRDGSWNDMPVNGGPIGGYYEPKGFVVEYGGMPGDNPDVQILATTSLTVPETIYYPTRSATICPSETVTFLGIPTTDPPGAPTTTEVYWYDDSASVTPIWTGNSFTTPALNTTTTFYSDNGCLSQRESFTVTVSTVPTLTVSPVAYTYDQNDTATPLNVTASSGCTLNWYDDAGVIIPPPSPPTPSTAVVGVTSYFVSQTLTASGCEGPKTEITVTVNGVPVTPDPPVVSDISYCQNETALALTATASSNCTLNWYTTATGGTSTATPPTPSTATVGITSYFVSQTDNSSGLESTRAEIQVTVNPTPTLLITNPAGACLPSTVDISASAVTTGSTLEGGVLSYWTDSAATAVLSNPNAVAVSGTYYIKVETTAGCIDIKPVTVVVSEQPVLAITNPSAVCSPTTVDLTATAVTTGSTLEGGVLSYWTDSAATAALSNPNAVAVSGTYYIKVETTAGCVDIKPVMVTIDPTPTLVITNPAGACLPSTVDLTASAVTTGSTLEGGVLSYWTDSAATAVLSNPNAVAVSGTYYIKVETTAGCIDIKPVTVVVSEQPVLAITNPSAVCSPTTVDLTATAVTTGSTLEGGVLSYWTDSAATAALSNPNAVAVSGTYYIKVETTAGCVDIKPVTVTINPAPTLVITNPAVACLPSTVDLTAAAVTTGSTLEGGVLSYWTDSAATAALSNPNVVAASGTYYIKVETTAGCMDIKPVAVAISEQPVLIITNPSSVCFPSTIDLTAASVTAGSTLEGGLLSYWTDSSATAALSNPTAVSVSGTYYIKVETTAGCVDIEPVTVTINPLPNIDLNLDGESDKIVCSDITFFSFTLDAGILDHTPTTDYIYIWSKDGSVLPDNTPTLDVSEIGVYTVEVISAFGCSQIRTITVKTSKSPTIDTIEIVDLTTNNSVTVNLVEPGDFQFILDDPNGIWQDSNVFYNVSGGEHTVYVSDKYGCPGDNRVIVVISAPKFFTPNNDGYNDYWNVKGLSDDDSKAIIYIFDRYGKLLKQWVPSSDGLGWDGTLNGSHLPSDDYWYTLKLENGRESKGHFSLIR